MQSHSPKQAPIPAQSEDGNDTMNMVNFGNEVYVPQKGSNKSSSQSKGLTGNQAQQNKVFKDSTIVKKEPNSPLLNQDDKQIVDVDKQNNQVKISPDLIKKSN